MYDRVAKAHQRAALESPGLWAIVLLTMILKSEGEPLAVTVQLKAAPFLAL